LVLAQSLELRAELLPLRPSVERRKREVFTKGCADGVELFKTLPILRFLLVEKKARIFERFWRVGELCDHRHSFHVKRC